MSQDGPIIDIGLGVTIRLRQHHAEPRLAGVSYWHQRQDGTPCGESFVHVKPSDFDDAWDLVSLEPLTLSPSLLCTNCGHHGFVTAGRWVPA